MEQFSACTRAYFDAAFPAPTAVQRQGWPRIAAGDNALLIAPTGSGKTLAAFLWCLDRLTRPSRLDTPRPGVRVLYVSPLKALVYDVERNLHTPLAGIRSAAQNQGIAIPEVRVDVRTGDTTAKQRRRQARRPGDILVTTPESLYLILGSQARETLRTVETVIVDEVHALAPGKRGAHLSLSLERLTCLCAHDPQRIGLSATARPLAEIARFLGGDRPVTVVDTSEPPSLDLEVVVPVADMTKPQGDRDDGDRDADKPGIWPSLQTHLLQQIRAHESTIVFVNSRGLCERLTHELNERADAEISRSHHGSLSHAERRRVEDRLQAGELPAVVATSSLELGIDMKAVDLVALVESPGAVSRGLQRIGRAGHGVGQVSKGRIYPKHRGDLLEAAVVASAMTEGAIEPMVVPMNPLDVLAQQLVAAVSMDDWAVHELRAVFQRSACFRDLPEAAFDSVLDMLSGHYPSSAFANLIPRINWDRDHGALSARRGAKMIAILSGGTIPDRGTYGVFLAPDGPRVGELDEEMVHETRAGELFTLGASTWRVQEISRDRVLVTPAPGEVGKLPFWHGNRPGRPIDLGRRMGTLVREFDQVLDEASEPAQASAWLARQYRLNDRAADNLARYIAEQRAATGTLPTDRRITIERYRDEIGDYRVCILSHFGARVHAPWALAIQARLSAMAGFDVQIMWTDDGIVLRIPDDPSMSNTGLVSAHEPMADELSHWQMLLPDADDVEDLVVSQLSHSSLFAGHFRENAARALLMPRRRPGQRTPLWVQRMKSRELLAAAREFPNFPIVVETYRSCLQDALDVPALIEMCRAIERREIEIDAVETRTPSPFARSLSFAYVANYLYDGDTPAAERRAQALSLDRTLLRQLLGQEDLRDLLDAEVIDEVERSLQCLSAARRARHDDGLHDVLRRVGDLTETEIAARTDGDHTGMLNALRASGRVVEISLRARDGAPTQVRYIAIEDAALYRDGLAVTLPDGIPTSLLASRTGAVDELLSRFSRTHGPFTAQQVSERLPLSLAHVETLLRDLERAETLLSGGFRPGGDGTEYCHPDVLRRIKKRTLASLREQVAPVDAAVLGRFVPRWHRIGDRARGRAALEQAIVQLEGLPLSFAELERVILPARVPDYRPEMLDELGATGWVTWVGCGALGAKDGRIALYRRTHAPALLADRLAARPSLHADASANADVLGPHHRAIVAQLETNGASFFVALQSACAPATTDEVMRALWDLIWAGYVTNDTFQSLRAFARTGASSAPKRPPRRGRGRRGTRAALGPSAGRWSSTRDLCRHPPSTTECAHRRVLQMLERHGVLTPEAARLEQVTGGFSAIYPVLSAMEEAGKVRRGYFVHGLGGTQFAYPGAVDRLRALVDDSSVATADDVRVLSAVDPANPYGWLVSWPTRGDASSTSAKRVAGASVVLVGGRPVLFLGKGQRRLSVFPAADNPGHLAAAIRALDQLAARKRNRSLCLASIDGVKAYSSPHAAAFLAAGYTVEPRGLLRDLHARP